MMLVMVVVMNGGDENGCGYDGARADVMTMTMTVMVTIAVVGLVVLVVAMLTPTMVLKAVTANQANTCGWHLRGSLETMLDIVARTRMTQLRLLPKLLLILFRLLDLPP